MFPHHGQLYGAVLDVLSVMPVLTLVFPGYFPHDILRDFYA